MCNYFMWVFLSLQKFWICPHVFEIVGIALQNFRILFIALNLLKFRWYPFNFEIVISGLDLCSQVFYNLLAMPFPFFLPFFLSLFIFSPGSVLWLSLSVSFSFFHISSCIHLLSSSSFSCHVFSLCISALLLLWWSRFRTLGPLLISPWLLSLTRFLQQEVYVCLSLFLPVCWSLMFVVSCLVAAIRALSTVVRPLFGCRLTIGLPHRGLHERQHPVLNSHGFPSFLPDQWKLKKLSLMRYRHIRV